MLPLRLALWRAGHYLHYRWQRTNRHGVHSPRVYRLADQVVPHRNSHWGQQIEALRIQLSRDHQAVELHDLGAGPHGQPLPLRTTTIGQIARTSARRRREGEFLLRLVRYLQPRYVLELGTNLGIGTAYLAAELPTDAHLVSVEGSATLTELATQHLSRLQLQAEVRTSTFNDFLGTPPPQPWELVLLDGHHASGPTLQYVKMLLPHMATGGILIVDDIRWNADMWAAWQQVQQLPGVSAVVERYHMGLLICHAHQAWERFVL